MRPLLRSRLLRVYRLPHRGLLPSCIGACVPAAASPRPAARCACSCWLAFAGSPRLASESRAFVAVMRLCSCAVIRRAHRFAFASSGGAPAPRPQSRCGAPPPRSVSPRSHGAEHCAVVAPSATPRAPLRSGRAVSPLRAGPVRVRVRLRRMRRRSGCALPLARPARKVGVFLFASLSLASPRGSPLVDAWSTLSRRRAPRARGCPSLRLYDAQSYESRKKMSEPTSPPSSLRQLFDDRRFSKFVGSLGNKNSMSRQFLIGCTQQYQPQGDSATNQKNRYEPFKFIHDRFV